MRIDILLKVLLNFKINPGFYGDKSQINSPFYIRADRVPVAYGGEERRIQGGES
jgi:hypothetical protein